MLYALHGFLGLTTDWKGFPVSPCDFYSFGLPSLHFGLQQWAEAFNSQVKEPSILVGYSLGGRLAMHALIHSPHLWKGAVLISSHTGLKSEEEKLQRQHSDSLWIEKFLHTPWDALMKEWNANDVFGGKDRNREEKNYSRNILADTLKFWSLALQEDLSEKMSQLNIPLLVIAGENDKRYSALAKSMRMTHHKSRTWIAPFAGHRVPWEAAQPFMQQLNSFLEVI